ncbi:MAG: RNA methyltransferase [Clostridia bacterium]
MDIITSKSNEKVKYIKSLNEKKFRQKYNAFYLEGIKVVSEVIDFKKAIDIEFIAYSKPILEKLNSSQNLIKKLEKISDSGEITIYEIKEEIFKDIVDTITPQGVLVVLKIPVVSEESILNSSSNILILDKIQDAGNLGTIIRSADAFGVKNIVCNLGTCDAFSNKVTRSTMGSILRTNILYLDEEKIHYFLNKLKTNNYDIISTALQGTTMLDDINYSKKLAIVLGNESNGISNEIIDLSTYLVKIPILDTAESLNVSVACGIILYKQFKK